MKLNRDIEIHHFMVSGERVCLSVTCLQRGGKKKKKRGGLGWAFFLASLSSLEVECLSPPPPLFELLALGQVTKQDSITGRWNPKWPRLPPYVCSCECVCLRGSHPYLSYILYLIFFVLSVFACLLHPSKHTLPLRPTPNNLLSHTPQTPYMYGLCF